MAGNTFGTIFKFMTFGESHGEAIGGVVEGCPPGIEFNIEAIQNDLNRRRPGQSSIVTQRKEPDEVVFQSGIFNGKTTGTPIGFHILNTNQKPKDYLHNKDTYRPSHADFTYDKKYGFRDYRGGGRSSARETVARVVVGAIAKQIIPEIEIYAYVSSVGKLSLKNNYSAYSSKNIELNPVRCPDSEMAIKMEHYIRDIRKAGDTVGGVVTCVIKNTPIGLGEPVFDKLHVALGKAMLSINAVKGFEYGSGFAGTRLKGSEHNDIFLTNEQTKTNNSGGIQGGISNGMDIYFNIAFKPVATIMQSQKTIDALGNKTVIEGKGRHDPCVVPRAVPIVEAMASVVIADYYLINKVYS